MTQNAEQDPAVNTAIRRRLDRLGLAGHEREWADRYLLCDHLVSPRRRATAKFEATSRFIRDLVAHRWVKTPACARRRESQAHPLSVDGVPPRPDAAQQHHQSGCRADRAPGDAAGRLGPGRADRGGAGRRAGQRRLAAWRPASSIRWPRCKSRPSATACATSTASSARQSTTAGRPSSRTTGCADPDPWEVVRPGKIYVVPARSRVRAAGRRPRAHANQPSNLLGIAYDRPVVGYGGQTASTRCVCGRRPRPIRFDFRRVLATAISSAPSSRTSPPNR